MNFNLIPGACLLLPGNFTIWPIFTFDMLQRLYRAPLHCTSAPANKISGNEYFHLKILNDFFRYLHLMDYGLCLLFFRVEIQLV